MAVVQIRKMAKQGTDILSSNEDVIPFVENLLQRYTAYTILDFISSGKAK